MAFLTGSEWPLPPDQDGALTPNVIDPDQPLRTRARARTWPKSMKTDRGLTQIKEPGDGGRIVILPEQGAACNKGSSMLKIPLDRLAYIVEKAREFDAETAPVDSASGSNPSDDKDVGILEATGDNPTEEELATALNDLDDEQRIEVLALMWLGRGDFDRNEWREALAQAREVHDEHETGYLIGTPLLADYLEIGLDLLGYSLEDDEKDRL
ncbi:MAG TPA: DUF3775 domain-containing protein [Stellaceae bacterium]|nr:DUF3775 domain-containing protein [Stellaceae bacterium]